MVIVISDTLCVPKCECGNDVHLLRAFFSYISVKMWPHFRLLTKAACFCSGSSRKRSLTAFSGDLGYDITEKKQCPILQIDGHAVASCLVAIGENMG